MGRLTQGGRVRGWLIGLAASTVTACGGGGGGSSSVTVGDADPSRAAVAFPPAQSQTGSDRKSALDLATGGNSVLSDATRGSGTLPDAPVATEVDAADHRAYVVDRLGLLAIDLAIGDRTVVSGPGIGTGPPFSVPEGLALDVGRGRVLVIDGSSAAIDAVDLATGDRSILSDATHGAGPPFTGPLLDVTADEAHALAYATDAEFVAAAFVGRVVAVDAASGDRSIVSSFSRGSGPTFQFAAATALDAARGRLLVCDSDGDRILAVDLVTGDRTVLSSGAVGAGAPFTNPTKIALDLDAGRLLVVDGVAGSGALDLVAVALDSGDRTVVVDALQGTGPRFLDVAQLAAGLAAGRWLVQDAEIGALLEVDLATGDRVLASQ